MYRPNETERFHTVQMPIAPTGASSALQPTEQGGHVLLVDTPWDPAPARSICSNAGADNHAGVGGMCGGDEAEVERHVPLKLACCAAAVVHLSPEGLGRHRYKLASVTPFEMISSPVQVQDDS